MSLGSLADFARLLGVNRSTVTRGAQAGRLVIDAQGRVDLDASLIRWHATAGTRNDVAARHAAHRGAPIPTAQPAQKTAPAPANAAVGADIAGSGIATDGRANARVLVLHYENAAIKLEMAQRRGLRLDLRAVGREALSLGAMLRAGVERVIDQTAPRLAAAGTDLDRRRIIAAELARLRWMVRRESPASLRRMRDAGKPQTQEKQG